MVNCMGLRTRKVADGGVVTVNAFVVVVAAVALTVAVVIGRASWQSVTGGDVSSSARSIMSGGASFTAVGGFAGGGSCSFVGGCHRRSRNKSRW